MDESAAEGASPKRSMAVRAAKFLRTGDIVNLGIGLPTTVPDVIPPEQTVHFHTENGMLGVGPTPDADSIDPDIVNAAKVPVGELPGSSYFHAADSFGMIRGGHVDVAIIGALQVNQRGQVANWAIPGAGILGVGGAMDLLEGARSVIVMMWHRNRDGVSKILTECSLPMTSLRPVTRIVTDLAIFAVRDGELHLEEVAPGCTLDEVRRATEAPFALHSPTTGSRNDE